MSQSQKVEIHKALSAVPVTPWIREVDLTNFEGTMLKPIPVSGLISDIDSNKEGNTNDETVRRDWSTRSGDTEGERVGTVQTNTNERAPVLKHKVVVSDLALVPAALSHWSD